ncbi:MAG: hypothetical protein IJR08_03490 [Bacilli bacterium]|nr:hypothetical protein [Bacilli bacterium]
MKKTRILAPAFAVIALGTAAAVTGTVAWYFAQSKVTINSSAVTSINPEPGLKVTLTAGAGTVVGNAVSTSANTPATVSHELMRDASVDMPNGKFYVANLARSSTPEAPVIESYREIAADKLKDGTHPVMVVDPDTGDPVLDGEGNPTYEDKDFYFATMYKAKFELSKKTGKNYALYYDNAALQVVSGSSIQESLRIGVRITTANGSYDGALERYFVIAPFRDANAADYVKGTDKTTGVGQYDTDHLLYGYKTKLTAQTTAGVTTYTAAVEGEVKTKNLDPEGHVLGTTVAEADKASYVGYMGDLFDRGQSDPAYTGTVEATVYTWFEGSDEHSRTTYLDEKAVETSLSFTIAEILA